jgi:hypothetical protein
LGSTEQAEDPPPTLLINQERVTEVQRPQSALHPGLEVGIQFVDLGGLELLRQGTGAQQSTES